MTTTWPLCKRIINEKQNIPVSWREFYGIITAYLRKNDNVHKAVIEENCCVSVD